MSPQQGYQPNTLPLDQAVVKIGDTDTVVDNIATQHPPGTARLLRIQPMDSKARLREIESGSVVFGRDRNCDIVIEDTSASRKHARLINYGSNWVIADMGSTNGTWVNDRRVQIFQLRNGDCIKIGRWSYRFFGEGDIESDYQESVFQMMTRDVLTGAWNKRYLTDVLDRELSRHFREKQPISFLMFDIDNLESINDEHGHVVGDELMKELGRRLCETTRKSEVFARYEGSKFALVLVNTDRDGAKSAVKRMLTTVMKDPFLTSIGDTECSLKFGLAVCEAGDITSREKLIATADRRLQKTKQNGCNSTSS